MTFAGHGTVSASPYQQRNDKVDKVEQKENHHEAMLNDASNIYRVCNGRPQRLLPTWQVTSHSTKLPYLHQFYQHLYTHFGGRPRSESAPIHFDVSCKYYVICLRHLRC